MSAKRRVAVIGSGNWGSTIGKIVGHNVLDLENFEDEVKMWVFDEIVNGKKLTEIINTSHENIKYLPGIRLPPNLIADPDLANCVKDADVLLFVVPHQFLAKACDTIKPVLKPGAYGCSLIKGLDEKPGVGVRLLTDLIRERLQIPCAVLMGANLANEVSQEMFCEATVASLDPTRGKELKFLFQTPYFRVSVIKDEVGAELCGALKNIVAVGAGLANGLGYGDNTKAAIIRLGFMEMKKFIFEFFGDRSLSLHFWRAAVLLTLSQLAMEDGTVKIGIALAETDKPVSVLEGELLGGQSAQGVLTAAEVYSMLSSKRLEHQFPIFTTIHSICQRKAPASSFMACLHNHPEHL